MVLLWKCMLATLGGVRDLERVKRFVREIEGLSPDRGDKKSSFKTSPLDFAHFRREVCAKYPTYVPHDIPDSVLDRLASAVSPQPIRPVSLYNPAGSIPNDPSQNIKQNGPNANLQPGTPAPTPPASPQAKPKKQQFQTDQTRPFVLPFSAANAKRNSKGQATYVPKSIDEAAELYKSHLRISTELWQTWKLREEFIADESGAAKLEAQNGVNGDHSVAGLGNRMSKLTIDDGEEDEGDEAEGPEGAKGQGQDAMHMLKQLEERMRQEQEDARARGDKKGQKRATQRVQDTIRLQRVELLYVRPVPISGLLS